MVLGALKQSADGACPILSLSSKPHTSSGMPGVAVPSSPPSNQGPISGLYLCTSLDTATGISSLLPFHSYTSLLLSAVTPVSFMSNLFYLDGIIKDEKTGGLTYEVICC